MLFSKRECIRDSLFPAVPRPVLPRSGGNPDRAATRGRPAPAVTSLSRQSRKNLTRGLMAPLRSRGWRRLRLSDQLFGQNCQKGIQVCGIASASAKLLDLLGSVERIAVARSAILSIVDPPSDVCLTCERVQLRLEGKQSRGRMVSGRPRATGRAFFLRCAGR